MGRGAKRALTAGALAGALVLAAAAPAAAWNLTFDGTRYHFDAAAGEVNHLDVYYTSGGTAIAFNDSNLLTGFDAFVDSHCNYGSDQTEVVCPLAEGPVLNLGDRDDTLSDGSPGPDTVDLGPGSDAAQGEGGDDTIRGGSGDDEFRLYRDDGGDTVIGDDGRDTATYDAPTAQFSRTASLRVSLDGQPNDGESGEGDNVQVERVISGRGADHLIGGDGADELWNAAGSPAGDRIEGRGGNDFLRGDSERDELLGEAGDDRLEGGNGDDTLDGGPGADTFRGDGGCCAHGNDVIQARDGEADTISSCGGGADRAIVDQFDLLPSDNAFETCESVDRATVSGPGGSGAGSTAISSPRRITLRALLGGGLPVTVTCPSACAIDASLLIDRRVARRLGVSAALTRIGRKRRSLPQAGRASLKVRPVRRAARRLRRARRLSVTVRVAVKSSSGSTTRSRRVTVRR